MLIYEFQKNALEKVKIQLSEFRRKKVINIRYLLNESNYTTKQIGEMFSVSRQTISGIKNNRVWTHTGISKIEPKRNIKEIRQIRKMHASNKYTLKELGILFNVHLSTIHNIVKKKYLN